MNDISARPRIRRTREQIKALLEEYEAAGLSIRKFALTRNLSAWTLSDWIGRNRSISKKQPRVVQNQF